MSTLYVDNLQPNLNSQVSIPNLQPLSGSLVQVQTNTTAQFNTRNSTSWGAIWSNSSISFTPTNASNTLLLRATFSYNAVDLYGNLDYFKFYDTTGSLDIGVGSSLGSRVLSGIAVRGATQDGNDATTVTLEAVVSAGTTSARTYDIYHRTEAYSSPHTRKFNHSNTDNSTLGWTSRLVFTVMEIAQ